METKMKNGRWSSVATQLYDIQQQIKDLQKQEATLKRELKTLSHGEQCRDGSFIWKLFTRKGNIDIEFLCMMEGVDKEKYRTEEIEMWRLLKL